jgi:hypothetical protein
MTLTIGEGGMFRTSMQFAKVPVTDDKILDVTPQSDRESLVNPKRLGATNVFILDEKNGLVARSKWASWRSRFRRRSSPKRKRRQPALCGSTPAFTTKMTRLESRRSTCATGAIVNYRGSSDAVEKVRSYWGGVRTGPSRPTSEALRCLLFFSRVACP